MEGHEEKLVGTAVHSFVYKTFEVNGLPDLEIMGGTHKGKILVPYQVRLSYRWVLTDNHRDSRGWESAKDCLWSAVVTGRRRLQNSLGIDLTLEFEQYGPLWLVTPDWLPAMARRHGPVADGWEFQAFQ